jgi:trimethylguanosine synthase
MRSSDKCPYGEKLQCYWDKRYQYFHCFDQGIRIDAEGLHTVMPEQTALDQVLLLPDAGIILDGFCGVGGLAIAYARLGRRVIAVDCNAERIAMAKHNASVYRVQDQITFILGNFFDVAAKTKADAVLLDPPWGWPRHRKLNSFYLKHFNPEGEELLNFSLRYFNTMILRTPKIFNPSELDKFNIDFRIHEDKLNDEVISHSIVIKSKALANVESIRY